MTGIFCDRRKSQGKVSAKHEKRAEPRKEVRAQVFVTLYKGGSPRADEKWNLGNSKTAITNCVSPSRFMIKHQSKKTSGYLQTIPDQDTYEAVGGDTQISEKILPVFNKRSQSLGNSH